MKKNVFIIASATAVLLSGCNLPVEKVKFEGKTRTTSQVEDILEKRLEKENFKDIDVDVSYDTDSSKKKKKYKKKRRSKR